VSHFLYCLYATPSRPRRQSTTSSHEQFLEIEDEEDIFLTQASVLQWLGLDRDHLVSRFLPMLRELYRSD